MSCHSTRRPSLLKRKRTRSEDEDVDNAKPLSSGTSLVEEKCKTPEENYLLSPESIDTCPGSVLSNQRTPLSGHETDPEHNYEASFLSPISERLTPLPMLSWADHKVVWDLLCHKDVASKSDRDAEMFSRHPCLQSRMRSILLDWLIEVCEVYNLHRETYHLTMDFIDRYLSIQSNIPKQQLQLIGITCLFIAAKVEEIYPPKLTEFAYVTDGACTESEILEKELAILKTLNWNLNPVTANNWLNMYLQLCSDLMKKSIIDKADNSCYGFLFPRYSGLSFVQIAKLVDFCMLDEGSLRFPYSVIAASALYHLGSKEVALRVSGMKWKDIDRCVHWMSPFALTLREEGVLQSGMWNDPAACVIVGDTHHTQTHSVDVKMLEAAQQRLLQMDIEALPVSTCLLTPPASSKKTSKYTKDVGNFT
ncbi:G1/S-specific cyclin-E [Schistocerca piceifrons]|uniref:G1/S-specific cyclin-E n=1 Tax=Schistocerca piceifrons TaxID=274613 RepID=UPI001F5EBE59|nr:G1/S-specific cyclin-E [Schistocerca piceifrons]XP_047118070.1 G1/S-specific cyclin-E [Schistocerca piceifrons]XP_047118071.1 G1/S-specific cyclin-E [Schistocerca piceifrons]XP_047118072.1 G1/S-specific cyclin-E [Schistocerca piceifrons]XP_047118073.1 G1/S-specific cyclin-E [Schistocerca piceifrons]XP_047118074.1 G1/S-specific cyclin-E [Schistocerca piceifrons]